MGIDETLFHVAARWWRQRQQARVPTQHAFVSSETRIRHAARILVPGTRIEMAEGAGGVGRNVLRFPAMLPQRAMYVYRLWFAHAAHADWEQWQQASTAAPAIAALLLTTRLQHHLRGHVCEAESCHICGVQRELIGHVAPARRKGLFADWERWLWARAAPSPLPAWLMVHVHALADGSSLATTAQRLRERAPAGVVWGHAQLVATGHWQSDAGLHDSAPAAQNEHEPHAKPAKGLELVARVVNQPKQLQRPPKPERDNPVVHLLEKVKTLEDYQGGERQMDGRDEADEHQEAIVDLTLSTIVRTDEATHTVLTSDVMIDGAGNEIAPPPIASTAVRYDEWDDGKRVYRKAHCAVTPKMVASAPGDVVAAWHAERLHRLGSVQRQLARQLHRLVNGRQRQPRMPWGDDLDIDAAVMAHVARVGGQQDDERVYVATPPRVPSFALSLLIDVSLSTDGWVNNKRVLDIETDALWLLAQTLTPLPVPVSIAGYCSHTRHDCRYTIIKRFAEPWRVVIPRLPSVEPQAYTRIGPALRHGVADLAAQPARRRVMLVVTDAKPTDYDRYEGRYGIADVRQAVREARQQGVHVRGLIVGARRAPHVATMFADHAMLRDVHSLPLAVMAMLQQLLH